MSATTQAIRNRGGGRVILRSGGFGKIRLSPSVNKPVVLCKPCVTIPPVPPETHSSSTRLAIPLMLFGTIAIRCTLSVAWPDKCNSTPHVPYISGYQANRSIFLEGSGCLPKCTLIGSTRLLALRAGLVYHHSGSGPLRMLSKRVWQSETEGGVGYLYIQSQSLSVWAGYNSNCNYRCSQKIGASRGSHPYAFRARDLNIVAGGDSRIVHLRVVSITHAKIRCGWCIVNSRNRRQVQSWLKQR